MKRALLFCSCLAAAGCPNPEAKAPAEQPLITAAPDASKPPAPKKVSARIGTHAIRDLAAEAARAELRAKGLLINFGTPDQHKYVSIWSDLGEARLCDDAPCAPFSGRIELSVYDWLRFDRVVVRARSSARRQRLRVLLNGRDLGRRPVGPEWSTLSFAVGKVLPADLHNLTLEAAKKEVELDWIWLTSAPKDALPPTQAKVATVSFGAPKQALVADPPRTLSYYLEVPKDGRLIFDSGAKGEATFSVYVTPEGEQRRRLYSEEVEPGAWQEGMVDLGELAGRVVRLDFSTKGTAKEAAWGDPHLVRPGPRPRVPAVLSSDQAKNLVYVVVDTVRQDVYSAFNSKTAVKTPRFAELADESTIFTDAYANAPWTKPSVASALSGLYPSTHGAVTEEAMLPKEVAILSEHLMTRGFTTAIFSANGYVSDRFGFARGWDHYVNFPRENKRTQGEDVYAEVIEWLKARDPDKRFFVYIQTVDPHVPYQAPGTYLRLYYDKPYDGTLGPAVSGYEHDDFNDGKLELGTEDRAYMIAQYHGEISYHDEHFGNFVDTLREMKLLDDTLFVMSNDHGEELFEHGKVGHGQSLYEELIRAPLLIRYPKILPKGARVSHPVSLVDLVPTMVEILGTDALPLTEGISLLGAVHDRPALIPSYAIAERLDLERAVRVGHYKLIASKEAKDMLFDLDTDPGEQTNLADERPIARRNAEIHLREGLAIRRKSERLTGMRRSRRYAAPKAEIEPELMEHLKALGYFND